MDCFKTIACVALSVAVLSASDISGSWSGNAEIKTSDGETTTYSIQARFTQQGEEVSGSIGRYSAEELAIRQGKIHGTSFSFEVVAPEAISPVQFELEVKEDRLEGQLKGQVDSGPISGKVTLSRTAQTKTVNVVSVRTTGR